jgi:hypothetical protein
MMFHLQRLNNIKWDNKMIINYKQAEFWHSHHLEELKNLDQDNQ